MTKEDIAMYLAKTLDADVLHGESEIEKVMTPDEFVLAAGRDFFEIKIFNRWFRITVVEKP